MNPGDVGIGILLGVLLVHVIQWGEMRRRFKDSMARSDGFRKLLAELTDRGLADVRDMTHEEWKSALDLSVLEARLRAKGDLDGANAARDEWMKLITPSQEPEQ